MCCSKFILFTTNIIVFVLGVIVVGISSAVVHRGNEYGGLLLEGVFALPVIILILGLFICILGFLGCFGALKESKCMLYTYAGIVLVLFIGEVTLGILLVTNPEGTKEALRKVLDSQFQQYDNDEPTAKAIDGLQKELHCCGVNGPSDWGNYWQPDQRNQVPSSCCEVTTNLCFKNSDDVYDNGCYQALIDEFQDIIVALGIAGVVLAIFMFFSMSTACGLARKHD